MTLFNKINALILMSVLLFSGTFEVFCSEDAPRNQLARTKKVQTSSTAGLLTGCNPQQCTQQSCGNLHHFLEHCYGCTAAQMNEKDWLRNNGTITFYGCKEQFCEHNPGFCHEKTPLEGLVINGGMASIGDRPSDICGIPLGNVTTRSFNINALNTTDYQFMMQTDSRLGETLKGLIEDFIRLSKSSKSVDEWVRDFDREHQKHLHQIFFKLHQWSQDPNNQNKKLTPEEVGECAILVEHIRSETYKILGIPVITKQMRLSGGTTSTKTLTKIGCLSEKL